MTRNVLVIGLTVLALSGCGQQHNGELKLTEFAEQTAVSFKPLTCQSSLKPTVIKMPETEILELAGHWPLQDGDAKHWIEKNFIYTSAKGEGEMELSLEVHKLYVTYGGSSMTGNIAARYRVRSEEQTLLEDSVVGHFTKVNWSSGSDEFRTVLRGALQVVAHKVEAAVNRVCAQSSL